MNNKIRGLDDSDKVFVTIALWLAMTTLFAVALSLPMLPNEITMFYKPFETQAQTNNKYNNLLLIFASIIPAVIIIVVAILKDHGKIQRNFVSIMLFSVMLSICMSGVIIYGIVEQFASSSALRRVNYHALATLLITFSLSVMSAVQPIITHSDVFAAGMGKRSLRSLYVYDSLTRYWAAGVCAYIVGGIACAFTPDVFTYIPLAAVVVWYTAFIFATARINRKSGKQVVLDDGSKNRQV